MILAAPAFYSRPPATTTTQQAAHKLAIPVAPVASNAVETASEDEGLFSKGDSGPLPPGAMAAAARAGRNGTGGSEANQAGDRDDAGSMQGDTAPGMTAGDSGLDRLRQSIRDTFGAPKNSTNGSAAGDKSGDKDSGENGEAKRDGAHGAGDSKTSTDAPPRPDGDSTTARASNADRNDPTSNEGQPITPGAGPNASQQGSHGSGRGGAGGTNGVLGAPGSPQQATDKAQPMAIKLTAITGVSPSQTEPQRPNQDVPAASANASRATGPLPSLADEQLADVTMQQLDVSPEHEGIVRRIFTRE